MKPMENELLAIAIIREIEEGREVRLLRKSKEVNMPVKGYEQLERAL